jgi:hypothetical protein
MVSPSKEARGKFESALCGFGAGRGDNARWLLAGGANAPSVVPVLLGPLSGGV